MTSSTVDIAKLEGLANALAQGLETLLAEIKTRQEHETKRLAKYKCLAAQFVQASTNTAAAGGYPAQGHIAGLHLAQGLEREISDQERQRAAYTTAPAVVEALKAREAVMEMIKPNSRPALQRCPVTSQSRDQEDLEMDFTTPGVQGNLECPMQHKLPITPNSLDPIAAELHQDHLSVQASDGVTNPSKCPIRFIDQHAPEEVAKYFEAHKHEIPRSHEICVKRYQQNEYSIRKLDAKYGNLVNMIQSLGVKHKQYLPEKRQGEAEHTDDEADEKTSTQAVEKWAENISQPAETEPEDFALDDEDRVPRSEKPLREVRVGESPSRPWGISVPLAPKVPRSVQLVDRRALASSSAVPVDATSTPAMAKAAPGCPFGQAEGPQEEIKVAGGEEQASFAHAIQKDASSGKDRPQVVFNGPVFFGYSPEHAAAFLQTMNLHESGK